MISAVVITKNEERNIKDCLQSLQWCDEILIIDDYSNDKTTKIAQSLGADVFRRSLNDSFAEQRNFGLKKTKGEWVLFVDADERVDDKLKREILSVISLQNRTMVEKYDGYFLKRKDYFGGRWLKHGETGRARLLRLGRKGTGIWKREVHEIWEIKGKTDELKNPLLHYSHPTVSDFLDEVNFYSSLHAKTLYEEGARSSIFRIIANPLGKFFQNYLFRLGFLDGVPGLVVALMMSFHSFLARSKLYTRKTRKIDTKRREKRSSKKHENKLRH